MSNYELELGQALFGQPSRQFDCPQNVARALDVLCSYFELFLKSSDNPFCNTAAKFNCGGFFIQAYWWGDEDESGHDINFKYKDLEVSWYKYLGRGMSCNKRKVSDEFLQQMVAEWESVVRGCAVQKKALDKRGEL